MPRFVCLALLLLSLLACPRLARAGYYTISYQYGGAPTPTPPSFGSSFTISSGSSSFTVSVPITTTLTWVKAAPMETPPATVSYVEYGYVYGGAGTNLPVVHGLVNPTDTLTDGLSDPPVVTYTSSTGLAKISQGYHVVQQAWAATITLTRTLSFTFTWDGPHSDPGNGGVTFDYAVLPNTLGGHSTVDTFTSTSPWDPANPRFFSGTNCSAGGTAQASKPYYVSHAQLLVGGIVVKDYYDTTVPGHPAAGPNVALGTNQSSASLSVSFDSTHFADATNVPAQLVVIDTGGNQYTENIKANTYNKAYVLANPHLSTPFVQVAFTASGPNMNHTVNNNNKGSITDTKPTILGQIPTYSAFYVCSHGGVGDFFDCTYVYPDLDLNNIHRILSSEVTTAVATKSVSSPPYNFVFVDGCMASGDSSLANAFCPARPGTDQVYLSWTTEVAGYPHEADWSTAVWTGLSNGLTVTDAIKYATKTIGPPDAVNENDGAAKIMPIGDSAAKLHGVYGLPDLGTAWHN